MGNENNNDNYYILAQNNQNNINKHYSKIKINTKKSKISLIPKKNNYTTNNQNQRKITNKYYYQRSSATPDKEILILGNPKEICDNSKRGGSYEKTFKSTSSESKSQENINISKGIKKREINKNKIFFDMGNFINLIYSNAIDNEIKKIDIKNPHTKNINFNNSNKNLKLNSNEDNNKLNFIFDATFKFNLIYNNYSNIMKIRNKNNNNICLNEENKNNSINTSLTLTKCDLDSEVISINNKKNYNTKKETINSLSQKKLSNKNVTDSESAFISSEEVDLINSLSLQKKNKNVNYTIDKEEDVMTSESQNEIISQIYTMNNQSKANNYFNQNNNNNILKNNNPNNNINKKCLTNFDNEQKKLPKKINNNIIKNDGENNPISVEKFTTMKEKEKKTVNNNIPKNSNTNKLIFQKVHNELILIKNNINTRRITPTNIGNKKISSNNKINDNNVKYFNQKKSNSIKKINMNGKNNDNKKKKIFKSINVDNFNGNRKINKNNQKINTKNENNKIFNRAIRSSGNKNKILYLNKNRISGNSLNSLHNINKSNTNTNEIETRNKSNDKKYTVYNSKNVLSGGMKKIKMTKK